MRLDEYCQSLCAKVLPTDKVSATEYCQLGLHHGEQLRRRNDVVDRRHNRRKRMNIVRSSAVVRCRILLAALESELELSLVAVVLSQWLERTAKYSSSQTKCYCEISTSQP